MEVQSEYSEACVSSYFGCCVVHYFLGGEVTLVPNQQLVDILTGVAINLLQPLLYIVVRFLQREEKYIFTEIAQC